MSFPGMNFLGLKWAGNEFALGMSFPGINLTGDEFDRE